MGFHATGHTGANMLSLESLPKAVPHSKMVLVAAGPASILGFILAVYIWLTPMPVPENYDELVHPDDGFRDFAAILFLGIVFPAVYLFCACLFISSYRLWASIK